MFLLLLGKPWILPMWQCLRDIATELVSIHYNHRTHSSTCNYTNDHTKPDTVHCGKKQCIDNKPHRQTEAKTFASADFEHTIGVSFNHKRTAHADTCYTYRHTHPFNGPFSETTRVSRYQKGKTNPDLTEARDSEWQWHQLGQMQVCTSLQTDNHASNPPLSFYRLDALPATQPTAPKHCWLSSTYRPDEKLINTQIFKYPQKITWHMQQHL